MFQYAAARRLAHVTNGSLLLFLGNEGPAGTHTTYGLNRFSIAGREVPLAGRSKYEDRPLQIRINARLPRFLRIGSARMLVKEKNVWALIPASNAGELPDSGELLFRPELLHRRRDTRLSGYWQNEKYFADIGDIIRADFTPRAALDEQSLGCLANIKSRPSAFLHVRRGDYLEPPFVDLFGTCTAEYYRQAVDILKQRHGDDLQIFVFGNDPGWIKENQIGGKAAMIVDWNQSAPERDLMLMRACQHAVIANSSFSWWGAWLGQWPGQTVIAPRTWFKAIPEFRDIVPERWIRL